MQSKRDQVQAHLFLMRRLTTGMLRGSLDDVESPGGRTSRGMLMGTALGAVIAVGAALFGLLFSAGDPAWKNEGALVVEKDTGNRYLFADGRLRPVLNYASALLLTDGEPKAVSVSSAATENTPHGPPIGIPGAPQSVPGPDRLADSPWQVCSATDSDTSGATVVHTRLVLGAEDAGRPLGADEGLLIAAPDGTTYLVWHGERLLLDRSSKAQASLGYGSAVARPVSAAVVAALPAGPDLAPPAVPGRGEPGPELDGRTGVIGEVDQVAVPGGSTSYHLLLREGFVPLTDTEAALVLGDPDTRAKVYGGGTPQARTADAAVVSAHRAPQAGAEDTSGLPQTPPRLVTVPAGQQACVVVRPSDGKGMAVSAAVVSPAVRAGDITQPTPDEVVPACLAVDQVEVPPGRGALIQVLSSAGTSMGDTLYLVTDQGVRFRVPSADALHALGYTAADARGLPATLLEMLPSGPSLDPAAAADPAKTGTDPVSACRGRT